jgi:hypothetical protein
MLENFRGFSVNDPFGRKWDVELRWYQNAISIRHADAIDCKYYISSLDERRELVVSLPHPALLALAGKVAHELTDAWVIRLAGLHVQHMITTWEDMDKTIAVPSTAAMEAYHQALEQAAAEVALTRR